MNDELVTWVEKIFFYTTCRGSMLYYHLWTPVEIENLICIPYCKILGQHSKKLLGKTCYAHILAGLFVMISRRTFWKWEIMVQRIMISCETIRTLSGCGTNAMLPMYLEHSSMAHQGANSCWKFAIVAISYFLGRKTTVLCVIGHTAIPRRLLVLRNTWLTAKGNGGESLMMSCSTTLFPQGLDCWKSN